MKGAANHSGHKVPVGDGCFQFCLEVVPLAGIEPALPKELDFESSASTNFTTGAHPAFRHRTLPLAEPATQRNRLMRLLCILLSVASIGREEGGEAGWH